MCKEPEGQGNISFVDVAVIHERDEKISSIPIAPFPCAATTAMGHGVQY
jgi:hypothetical protein